VTSPTSLRTFLTIWIGQTASILGSRIATFALTLWVWEATEQATPLSLLAFFTATPPIIASLFSGIIIDRFPRKQLMLLGDTVAGFSTIAILLLLLTNSLAIWHLYLAAAVSSLFGYLQWMSLSASMSMIVPQQHYTRVSALESAKGYGSNILAPALGATLYYAIGLTGILILDLMTFFLAITTLAWVTIPQPPASQSESANEQKLWQQLSFGFRYILKRPSLLAILIFLLSGNFVGNIGGAIFPAMILARSDDNAAVLASVEAASVIGGLMGATFLSIWGGFQRRIHGLLLGSILSRISGVVLGLAPLPWIWSTARFWQTFFGSFVGSSNQAIWLSKVEPAVQGRVFTSRYLIAQVASPIGIAVAGPLADFVFEPAMQPTGLLAGVFGGVFGTSEGSGMALQFTLVSLLGSAMPRARASLYALGGYLFPVLRDVEKIVPDHEINS
jgi:MFS family permease